jgi:hypothetical protein
MQVTPVIQQNSGLSRKVLCDRIMEFTPRRAFAIYQAGPSHGRVLETGHQVHHRIRPRRPANGAAVSAIYDTSYFSNSLLTAEAIFASV